VIKSTRAPTRKIEGIEKKIVANCVGQNHHGRFPATCYRGPWLRLQVTDALRRVAICQHSLAAVHFFYTLSCLVIFLIFPRARTSRPGGTRTCLFRFSPPPAPVGGPGGDAVLALAFPLPAAAGRYQLGNRQRSSVHNAGRCC
jgi:hypothetical protein